MQPCDHHRVEPCANARPPAALQSRVMRETRGGPNEILKNISKDNEGETPVSPGNKRFTKRSPKSLKKFISHPDKTNNRATDTLWLHNQAQCRALSPRALSHGPSL